MWTGAISFGLIYIPVKMYDATQSHSIDFDLLRRSDHCKIHYARICRETNDEVPYNEIVRGFQYRKGDYVILEDDDFKKVNIRKVQTISIAAFVDAKEIEQTFLEKPYFLEPVKEAQNAYALLREALIATGKVAIARYVMRTREHLCLLMPKDNVVVLNQIRFADELRSFKELDLPQKGTSKINPQELTIAVQLIEQLSQKWTPEIYKDTYYEDLKRIIQEKIEGRITALPEQEPVPATTTDLFAKLNESLKMAKLQKKAA
jgi:DNA end-binding protein Ku